MNRILMKLEKMFMAVTFAEAGDQNTAMRLAGINPADMTGVRRFFKHLECCFAAAAFAEANCHEFADPDHYLAEKPAPKVRIHTFLKDVGLQNARVRYGVVMV